jgi:hypothetical protein
MNILRSHRMWIAVWWPLSLAACSDNPVGRICDLGLEIPAQPGGRRLALARLPEPHLPEGADGRQQDPPDGFQALSANKGMCTATCESDDDCDKVPESPCVTGFTCGVALTVGPFCCQKFCICKDYVVLPESGKLPDKEACDATNPTNVCCNLEGRVGNPTYPNCPG